MYRRLLEVLLALSFFLPATAQTQDSLSVVFWNVENFFDYRPDGAGESELEFSATGVRHWTKSRFYTKCAGIAKVLLMIADHQGRLPDAVGFAELENAFVLRQLVNSTALRKLDYAVVHYDSPDHRGIDCGLIYRKSTLHLVESCPKHIYDSAGAVMATRDILLVRFDSLAVLVNHHPSKVGGKVESRTLALDRMNFLCDSLRQAGCPRVLCIGDFNEDLWSLSPSKALRQAQGPGGTIKYNGTWEKIDGCFSFGPITVEEEVFCNPVLLEEDRNWGGSKPRRTYSGLRWNGGLSDHLPVIFRLKWINT